MHRHESYWEDPNDFKPERFEGGKALKNEAYMPFARGPRFCIGNHLALLEMKVILYHLYQNEVEIDSFELDLITPMTLSIKNKIGVTVD